MAGIRGFGTTLTGSTSGAAAQVLSVGIGGISVDSIDLTSGSSTNRWSEFLAGFKDAGTIPLRIRFVKTLLNTFEAIIGAAAQTWTIAFSDGSSFACSGYVKGFGISSESSGDVTADITIKCTGEPSFTPAV